MEGDWIQPDEAPRPLVVYGFASDELGAFEMEPHSHAKSQFMFVQRGALSCEVDGGLWIVPPRSAIWIPGGSRHASRATGRLEGYCAFLAPDIDVRLPARCCTVAVTPLLRELIVRAARLPLLYEQGGANSRLASVLLDELATARPESLHLPMPADERLQRVFADMIRAPAEPETLDGCAAKTGMSTRTFERLIRRETGMSFGRWRRQLAVVLAVQRLADGATIQQAAADLGYESVPGFVTMFRKVVGLSPGRFMAERNTDSTGGGLTKRS